MNGIPVQCAVGMQPGMLGMPQFSVGTTTVVAWVAHAATGRVGVAALAFGAGGQL